MKIILTAHAKQRLKERGLNMKDVEDTLNFPEYSISRENKTEFYKKINERLLKIICISKGKFIKIITLIWK